LRRNVTINILDLEATAKWQSTKTGIKFKQTKLKDKDLGDLECLVVSTSKGVAHFPKLIEADTYKGKTSYKTGLIVDPQNDPQAAEFLDILREISTKALATFVAHLDSKGGKQKAAAKKLKVHFPFEAEYDDEGEETGRFIVKVKSNATVAPDGAVSPPRYSFFDAKGAQIKKYKGLKLWGGSELRIEVMAKPYAMLATDISGVTLYINAVQIIQLQGGSASSGNSGAFGVEENGFEMDEGSSMEEDGSAATDDSDSGDSSDF
jgi:hypothetical protein